MLSNDGDRLGRPLNAREAQDDSSSTPETEQIIGHVHRLIHATTPDDQFSSLAIILEYLREDFLPPPALPPLQSFLLRAVPLPDPLSDLVFTIVSYLAEFFDPDSDFSAIFSLTMSAYPLPSATAALHALLKGQFAVAREFFEHFQDLSASLSPEEIATFLLCLSKHKALIPDLVPHLPVMVGFCDEADLSTELITFLRRLTVHELGRAAIFSAGNSARFFNFGADKRPTLKLILLLAFHEPASTLKLLLRAGALGDLVAALREGIVAVRKSELEICRYLCECDSGVGFLIENGLLDCVARIEMAAGFEKWVRSLRVMCAAVCNGPEEIIAQFGVERLVEGVGLALSGGGADDRPLLLRAVQMTFARLEREGPERMAAVFEETELLDALLALQHTDPLAGYLCGRLAA
jgi:hypothetical protein